MNNNSSHKKVFEMTFNVAGWWSARKCFQTHSYAAEFNIDVSFNKETDFKSIYVEEFNTAVSCLSL